MEEFITYQRFTALDEADFLIELLKSNHIPFEIEDNSSQGIAGFTSNTLQNQFCVKIMPSDLERAEKLVEENAQFNSSGLPEDYYLFEFTDEELMEILEKPDEWDKEDYINAQKILKERGKEISVKEMNLLKKQRLANLSKQENGYTGWIIAGYIFAILGGLLGIFIGWHLMTYKKTLPNGEKVYGYTDNARANGRIILFIAVISFVGGIVYKISQAINK